MTKSICSTVGLFSSSCTTAFIFYQANERKSFKGWEAAHYIFEGKVLLKRHN